MLILGLFSRFSVKVSSQEVFHDYSYWAQLCETFAQIEDYEQANAACNSAISLNAKDPKIWEIWANVLLKLQKYPQALVSFQQLLRLKPESSFASIGECEVLYNLNQYEQAIGSCELALKKDQSWQNASPQRAWYFRGEAFRQLNQLENAFFSYDWAIKTDPTYSPAFSGMCLVFFQENQYQSALEACQTARFNNSWDGLETTLAWEYEGKIYHQLQQYSQALNAYNEVLAREPQNGLVWRRKAEILETIGNYSQAITANAWALQFMPDDRLTLTQQCALLNLISQSTPPANVASNSQNKETNKDNQGQGSEQNDYTKALASCDQALQKGTGNWNELGPALAWNQRGNALIGLKRYEEALESFEKALSLEPNYGEAWRNRSVALWHLEEYPQALMSVEQAITINPMDSQAWFNKAIILTQQKQYNEAITAYDQALAGNINYQSPSAKVPILVNQSAVFWQLKQYQAALLSAQSALDLNPDSLAKTKALYNKSLALISLENYQQAEETLKYLLEIAPENQSAQDAMKFIQQKINSMNEQK
ncbi:Tetratricopeptide TPR_2 repeat protein [Gloeothece citriformis PCC 7424]|uniref:Tetratricopeptide TPR_2 repeat protein n=1 Tax=Gloeothece citriformis (strain PCC 7424) TaxID=65393 RepID=B7KB58_GLOC7|nr:tetratricopeptide repeat protein [Gloeothece citriformis]ACK70168.1 Tetratricopeptide TPR_2 repeat protein [Gloeothece citriformis PCC 7424]